MLKRLLDSLAGADLRDPREQRRRNTDQHWFVVAWQWLLAPIVEGWCGISLVRLLCIYFAWKVGQQPTITLNALWLALASLAAAFGEKVFVKLINQLSYKGRGEQRDTTERRTTEVIVHTQDSDHTFAVADEAHG